MRTGVEVGQRWRCNDDRGLKRDLFVIDVQDGFAVCTVKYWRGKSKMLGMRVMLPDDHRYQLVTESGEKKKIEPSIPS